MLSSRQHGAANIRRFATPPGPNPLGNLKLEGNTLHLSESAFGVRPAKCEVTFGGPNYQMFEKVGADTSSGKKVLEKLQGAWTCNSDGHPTFPPRAIAGRGTRSRETQDHRCRQERVHLRRPERGRGTEEGGNAQGYLGCSEVIVSGRTQRAST